MVNGGDDRRGRLAATPALAGLLAIQMLLGYEWLVSGVTKIVRGGFPAGLAGELRDKSEGAPGWYRSFLDAAVIPNAQVFGYLIEIGELLVGAALIGAAIVWLVRWERLSDGGRSALLTVTILAALAAVALNVNFHFAGGGAHPWLIPKSGFEEGIDLDSLMPALELVLVGVSASVLRSLRRSARAPAAGPAGPAQRRTPVWPSE